VADFQHGVDDEAVTASERLVKTALREMLETPVGPIQLAVDDNGRVVEILLPNRNPRASSPGASPAAMRTMRTAKRQLGEYFAGERSRFDLPLQLAGSHFERLVWARLLDIPYGETTSYGAIATELGLVNGARAVGRANGANPIPIVIPCHRVTARTAG